MTRTKTLSIVRKELAKIVVKPLDVFLAITGAYVVAVPISTQDMRLRLPCNQGAEEEKKITHHQPNVPRWKGRPSSRRFQASCSRLRFRSPRELFIAMIDSRQSFGHKRRLRMCHRNKAIFPPSPKSRSCLIVKSFHVDQRDGARKRGGEGKTEGKENSRKYRSVLHGNTSVFALMPFMAALKSPL